MLRSMVSWNFYHPSTKLRDLYADVSARSQVSFLIRWLSNCFYLAPMHSFLSILNKVGPEGLSYDVGTAGRNGLSLFQRYAARSMVQNSYAMAEIDRIETQSNWHGKN